jgi:predicted MPP superfamily phosphohydrolase
MTVSFVIAVAVVIGLLLFVYQQVRRPVRGRSRWVKRVRVGFAAVLLFIGCVIFWAFFVEPNRLIVRHETIQIDQWPRELNDLRIAVLSDIHAGGSFIDERKLRTIVERTNQLQPEMIVIAGDFISGDGRRHPLNMAPDVFAPILKELRAPLGVYSVLGNHDWWYNGGIVRAALEQNGIKVLENEVFKVEARGTSFWLVGLADLWTRPQRILETMAQVPENTTVIALTHNPDIFPRVPQRVQLLIAGHTHGAQVHLPFIGYVVQPSNRYGERYAHGHVFENGHHLFVTTGIGTSIVPVRFGVTPEIVLLTVKSPIR